MDVRSFPQELEEALPSDSSVRVIFLESGNWSVPLEALVSSCNMWAAALCISSTICSRYLAECSW